MFWKVDISLEVEKYFSIWSNLQNTALFINVSLLLEKAKNIDFFRGWDQIVNTL